jgi:hypothetical protein
MKIGDKIICINADNQVNDFEIINKVKKGNVYTIRKFSSIGGIIVNEFIHGYFDDGEEACFEPKRFVLLEQMKYLRLT